MIRPRIVRFTRRTAVGAFAAAAALVAIWLLLPFPADLLARPPQSTVLLDRHGEPLRVFLAPGSVHHVWAPYAELGEWLPKAIVAAEDQRFWRHPGIDGLALARAVRQNAMHLRRVSGASTISTQVIRMAMPRARTFATKCREFFLATQMERSLSKTEILEQYLNRAPFGANLVGAEAASVRYFGKRARDLSLPEAALLAGLPQSPTRHRPDIHPESAARRRAYVLARLLATGAITAEQRVSALRTPLPTSLLPHPFAAPHFCEEVMRLAAGRLAGGRVPTTLDAEIQRKAEAALQQGLAGLRDVHGGAIVVLDTETAEVLALVGSHDVHDTFRAGRFNHALAWRSPGSALKPFAYALAIDQGRITPASALADIPRQFTAYQPANFDGGFRGVVSAREALVQSLNIPALDLVQACSPAAFHAVLADLGIASRTPRTTGRLGTGAVLGNTDVRLLDLTGAYADLGRRGLHRAPVFAPWLPLACATNGAPLSPEASWIVLDMLSGADRAQTETGHQADVPRRRVAWKTGTSSGLRDAWTLAVTPTYTLGVWLGNSDGRPAAALVGVEAAAPLAFNLLARLGTPGSLSGWFEPPSGVVDMEVCAVSGARLGADCPRRTRTTVIEGTTRPDLCSVHRRVAVAEGRTEVREVWPADVEDYLRRMRDAGATLPAAPRVATPAPHEVFRIQTDRSASVQTLALRASGAAPLHWFLDGSYLGCTGDSAPLPWTPAQGHHVLLCCDADGRATAVRFSVE
jgi:penicillin-binding protein 1C